ncbi:hypothetical protein GCM10023063_18560 [Arthrobacter methylotrophus]|uniref:Poly A polymerase head domain-containing protein n=1 Tax=Arthrobacter methylotrophus TaxID=121291 RepID=A0ABV5UPD1_9MICC
MTTIHARQPKGIPVGGQFAPGTHSEAAVTLPRQWDTIPDLIELTQETERVLNSLRAAGGRPLIVGGAVRDGLLSRTRGGSVDSMDVDIEVYGLSKEEVRRALPGDVNEFGQDFGVFNTSLNGQDFDVALPRQDNKTGGRPPRLRRRHRPGYAVRDCLRPPRLHHERDGLGLRDRGARGSARRPRRPGSRHPPPPFGALQ